jgi:hypothetical protein
MVWNFEKIEKIRNFVTEWGVCAPNYKVRR